MGQKGKEVFHIICCKRVSDKWELGRNLEELREPFMWISGRREFRAAVVASTEAPIMFKELQGGHCWQWNKLGSGWCGRWVQRGGIELDIGDVICWYSGQCRYYLGDWPCFSFILLDYLYVFQRAHTTNLPSNLLKQFQLIIQLCGYSQWSKG